MAAGGADDIAVLAIVAIGRSLLAADDPIHRQPEQSRELRQNAFGEIGNGVLLHQVGRRTNDQLQATPVLGECVQLLVGTQRRADRRDQPGVRQFPLGAIVIDVILLDHRQFRGVARFTGTQDQSTLGQAELIADETDELETCLGSLHHHVEEHHGNIAMAAQQCPRLRCAEGVQQLQRSPEDPQILQREAGDRMDLGVVVDDQHLPG